MRQIRVIPALLLKKNGLVKTIRFSKSNYLGDPINIVKIFNEKEVDELVLLDIDASVEGKEPNFALLEDIASECFMPLGYGGGIKNIEQARRILNLGIEKVIINSIAHENPDFVGNAAACFGSQSVVVSIDVKKNLFGKREVFSHSGTKNTKKDPVVFAKEMEKRGVGELLIHSIDRDGTMKGYDLDLIQKISKEVSVPVIACGGAGNIEDLKEAVRTGHASAVAAGSLFVYQGKHKAVLISYPTEKELEACFEGFDHELAGAE